MSKFIQGWLEMAGEFLAAEWGRSVDLLPGAAIGAEATSLTLMVDLAGDWEGTFTVSADRGSLEGLLGLAAEQADGEWQRLFRRICIDAAADLTKRSGRSCEVAMISPEPTPVGAGGMGYQLRSGEAMVALMVADLVAAAAAAPTLAPSLAPSPPPAVSAGPPSTEPASLPASPGPGPGPGPGLSAGFSPAPPSAGVSEADLARKGIELLLDVELEASLRFGSRALSLTDLLQLGPGDVVQLDRALTDPVELIVGDKIVARGEVVLVNGNFGLQVTEVAEPRRGLESIRCLF